ncbi:MAG: urease accessory protein UreH [Blastocatellia bacterium]|nr:urease accessory protein UreH [Blastocatellia bacterium]
MQETFSFALGLGFLLGLKHATEADHLMAVTTIVSEHRSVWRSALVGALWGAGHTASLLIAGVIVILLQIAIPQRIATMLEFAVALMIIFLGGRVLFALLRKRQRVHVHSHKHDGEAHTHLHFHNQTDAHQIAPPNQSHDQPHSTQIGWRPLIVGMIHGLAGSAALTLLILTEVMRGGSMALGFAYLLIFGIGSIGGMLLMSAVISVPFVLTATRFERVHLPIQIIAGIGSVLFGIYYAWEILHEA